MVSLLPERFGWAERFEKYPEPVLRPNGRYAADCIFNPAAVVKDGRAGLLCRVISFSDRAAPENWSVSSLIWSWSEDGRHFVTDERPLLFPDGASPYRGGFEDPRLTYIPDEGLWLLTYTGVRSMRSTPGLIAWSRDLENWEFGGEAFPARAVAVINRRIGGKYWAYYGNSSLFLSWSDDLRTWHTAHEAVVSPRAGYFDSQLCESAAPPVFTEDGILLFYNGASGRNADYLTNAGLSGYRAMVNEPVYSIGCAPSDPRQALARCDKPILTPEYPFELYGLVGTTLFASGLVEFAGEHLLYYGCADTRIGMAHAAASSGASRI